MADGGWLPSHLARQAEERSKLETDAALGDVAAQARLKMFADLAARRLAADARLVVQARKDPDVFIAAAGRIEGGKYVGRQAGAHSMIQRHLTVSGETAAQSVAAALVAIGHGKSNQVTRWRLLWELGRNPGLRCAILSATTGLPEKILAGIKGDIESNPWVKAVFPHLRPGSRPGQRKWDETSIHVEREDNLPDPSLQVYGLTSKVLGARIDLLMIDDLLNLENTLTPYMRQRVWDKVRAEYLSRRPPHTRSRVWLTGHVWTEDDAVAEICKLPGARVLRLGARVQRTREGRVITSADKEWDETLAWLPLVPELWTREALERRYVELGWAAGHMLDNRFMKRAGQGLPADGLAAALERGFGLQLVERWNPVSTGCPVFVGVDLSTGEGEDKTVIVVVALMGNGDRRVLCIESGRWEGPEIRDRLISINRRFCPTMIAVEANAQQRYIRQFLGEAAHVVPVQDHTTGGGSRGIAWGLRSLALELTERRWQLPKAKAAAAARDELAPADPDVRQLLDDGVNFSPDRHPGDHLMAWWIVWLQIKKFEGDWS
jgi:hypothetical protein